MLVDISFFASLPTSLPFHLPLNLSLTMIITTHLLDSQVLKESKFKEHGRLTPEEFVAAGDFLSYKFPVWSWYVRRLPASVPLLLF